MDDKPSFRFSFSIVAIMFVLALTFLMLISLPGSRDVPDVATGWLLYVIGPILGALTCVGVALIGADWLNRRDDPRHQKRPPDSP